ncbi:biopolymer transporter ExbD [Emcibacter sp.]|uniref:ExbD/TolR family protein n=1 Tax=Emcibacter sp. TaxID=1979954 RepID=UPI002AA61406|nr:biopolymer transporter ExbD [Emcibacter sp.]
MRHKRKGAEDDTDIDMTPMLDIVFIMLIFFIVTASFLKETGVEISRPDSSQKPKEPTEAQSIFIDITARDEVWYNKRRIDVRAVRPNVERDKAKMDTPSVVIKADRESSSGKVIEVVEGVRQAGVINYVVATPKAN